MRAGMTNRAKHDDDHSADDHGDDGTAAAEAQQSPLRGSLSTNAFDGDLHDMGGAIGPASDATAAADPSRPSQDVQQAETRAVESGAVAVDSPPSTIGRDDPDDPAGGDVTGSPHAARDEAEQERSHG
jgi:hypothetical protein